MIPKNVKFVLNDINSNILNSYIDKLVKESEELQQAKDKLQNDYQEARDRIEELQQRIDKAIKWIKITIKIIKEQPTENDEWILERLNSFLEILGDKE